MMVIMYTSLSVFPQSRLSLEAASQTGDGVMCNLETRESKILLLCWELCLTTVRRKHCKCRAKYKSQFSQMKKNLDWKFPLSLLEWGVSRVCLAFDFMPWFETCTDLCKLLQFLNWSRAKGGGDYVITCLIVLVKKHGSEHICCPRHARIRGMTGCAVHGK